MINNLRISVTQRCNLKCPYCHREGQLKPEKEISLEEIKEAAKIAHESGIRKIKITGGEPLLRKDIVEIVQAIHKLRFDDISMVTNGSLLGKLAKQLKEAGLNRVNIGCDSLVAGNIKGRDNMMEGLVAAKAAGLTPIKINMVVLKGINDTEINEMIAFARTHDAILQLIELINTDDDYYEKYYFSLGELEKEFRSKAKSVTRKEMHNREQFDLGDVKVELVRPYHNRFCQNCARIRLTSDGKLKPCLMRNDNLIDFTGKQSFEKAIELKLEQIR